MKREFAEKAVAAAAAALLAAPLLGWSGMRGFAGAHGFDTPDVHPRFSLGALLSGKWQKQVADHFAHVFFGRTELLFLKNGVHDAVSFGADRAGFAGSMIQGRRGFLFERPYAEIACRTNLPIENPRVAASSAAAMRRFMQSLETFCASARPDGSVPAVAFVMAPNKAETMRGLLPRRILRFAERGPETDPQPYRAWKGIADSCGMASVAPQDAAPATGSPEIAAFPYTGTHWTVHSAGLAASAALERAAPGLRRPLTDGFRLVRGTPDDARDRDLAGLLNVPIRYRRSPDMYAHAVFSAPTDGKSAKIVVIGDSFGEQVREALVRGVACAPEDVRLWFNEFPPAADFRNAVVEADALLFVHSAPSLAGTRVRTTLLWLANDLVPDIRPGRKYALGRSPFVMRGEWEERLGGRTVALAPGRSGEIELVSQAPLPRGSVLSVFPADAAAEPPPVPIPEPDGSGKPPSVRFECPTGASAPLELAAFEVTTPATQK